MAANQVSILDGNTFVVCDRRGDCDASPTETQGLFDADTRFLSRWVLTVNGKRPTVLSTDDVDYNTARFFLAPTSGTTYVDADLSVMRVRSVWRGFHEDLRVINHGKKPVDIDVRLEAAADFADLFEVKDALAKKGTTYHRLEEGALVLGYQRDTWVRETRISAPGATFDDHGLGYRVHLESHEEWNASLDVQAVTPLSGGVRYGAAAARVIDPKREQMKKLLAQAPQLESSSLSLVQTYRRSVVDLASLRFFPALTPGQSLPAAGLPWFMAVFGRDSLFTSLQALPFNPELARTTLRYLAAWQGDRVDDFRDEEPGKILHELRGGEMTAFHERPHSPYYGSADATALFLVLLDEYELWSGDDALVRALEFEARLALRWLDEYGDRNHDGYIEYERKQKTGLENQCWKDSWNSIVFADGRLAALPRATCELQGYAYDAKKRCARLARAFWKDTALAEKLDKEAAALKQRFNADFWMKDRGCFALALDGTGKQVDSITSNIGHLLWSGIVDDDKVEAIVNHLMGPALFSGWGIRTMASTEGAYNPIGYHVGTVWPFDSSIVALGLNRYGYREESSRIAAGILDAAVFFDHRLPEAFAGYPRE